MQLKFGHLYMTWDINETIVTRSGLRKIHHHLHHPFNEKYLYHPFNGKLITLVKISKLRLYLRFTRDPNKAWVKLLVSCDERPGEKEENFQDYWLGN